MLRHSIESQPRQSFPIPTHYGQVKVHPNDVTANRAKARKLAKLLCRSLGGPVLITRDTRTISKGAND